MANLGVDWWALVGPVPQGAPAGIIAVPHDRSLTLAGPCQVGPLHLRPGGKLYTDWSTTEPFQLAGVTEAQSYPIIVEGTWPECRGAFPPGLPGQQGNERAAGMALHRLCCLLSLAWGGAWRVRWAPTEPDRLPPQIPDSWPPPPMAPTPSVLDPAPQALPDWVALAWDKLTADPDLASALTFWHQGVLLTTQFPSFALVAFSGCVESLSTSKALAVGLEGKAGSAARLWATARLVADEDDLATLKKQWEVYDRRSGTAHGRTTHGIETAAGAVFLLRYRPPADGSPAHFDLDRDDEAQLFTLRILPGFGHLATRLLYKALDAGEP